MVRSIPGEGGGGWGAAPRPQGAQTTPPPPTRANPFSSSPTQNAGGGGASRNKQITFIPLPPPPAEPPPPHTTPRQLSCLPPDLPSNLTEPESRPLRPRHPRPTRTHLEDLFELLGDRLLRHRGFACSQTGWRRVQGAAVCVVSARARMCVRGHGLPPGMCWRRGRGGVEGGVGRTPPPPMVPPTPAPQAPGKLFQG